MTREEFLQLRREYRKQVRIIREHQDFESLTFSYHPAADQARREVAAMVPTLLNALNKLV